MRTTVADHSVEWAPFLASELQRHDLDADKALDSLGQEIAGQIRDAIIKTTAPPLSPITVMLRGMRHNNPDLVVTGATVGQAAARVDANKTNYGASDKPLIDSGVLLGAVDYEVDTTSEGS